MNTIVTIPQTDKQLWESLTSGNWKAFETIYNRYIRLLYQEISKRIDDINTVEDLTQDIFLSLWNKREVIKINGDIYPYLYGMAINRVLNYYRSNRIRPQFVELWEELPEQIADLTELSLAFKQAHTEELESLLERAIQSLPTRMKQVYTLKYQDNRTISQIAEELSTSPHTVNNQLKAIRKRFLKSIKQSSYIFF